MSETVEVLTFEEWCEHIGINLEDLEDDTFITADEKRQQVVKLYREDYLQSIEDAANARSIKYFDDSINHLIIPPQTERIVKVSGVLLNTITYEPMAKWGIKEVDKDWLFFDLPFNAYSKDDIPSLINEKLLELEKPVLSDDEIEHLFLMNDVNNQLNEPEISELQRLSGFEVVQEK
jgi:hypothetical protein